jgi:hypothetical protein
MAVDNDTNIVIETSGLTAAVATDVARFGGITAHFQMMKLAYGATGTATVVTSSSPLPVTIAAGMTATISGFTGTIYVQGPAGGPVVVSGTVNAIGLSGSPVYVSTQSGTRVEVTGGRPLAKSTDSVSVWGPSGLTYVYANLVDSSGAGLGISGDALKVSVVGAAINATVGTTLSVQGFSGGYALNINDTSILTGMTAIYGQVVGLRTDLTALGVGRPSAFKTGRLSVSSAAVGQMDSSGYTTTAEINIKALSTNTDFVYIGNTSGLVGSSFGYALDPGESVSLNVINTNKVYAISNTGTQVITYLAS